MNLKKAKVASKLSKQDIIKYVVLVLELKDPSFLYS
jgi:hypothetical protein